MPFKFRLDRVLEWEREKLDLGKRQLAECRRLVVQAEGTLARLRAEYLVIEREWIGMKSIDGAEAASLARYRLGFQRRERAIRADLHRRQQELLQHTDKVRLSQRKVTTLENLRARKQKDFNASLDREMERLATESYLAGWAVRKAVGPPA